MRDLIVKEVPMADIVSDLVESMKKEDRFTQSIGWDIGAVETEDGPVLIKVTVERMDNDDCLETPIIPQDVLDRGKGYISTIREKFPECIDVSLDSINFAGE